MIRAKLNQIIKYLLGRFEFINSSVIDKLLLFFVPIGIGFYSVIVGQDVNFDLLNYHLYNPYAYLNNRIETDLAPAGLQTYFNPFLDLAYFTGVVQWHPKLVGFILGTIQGLNYIVVQRICYLILKKHDLSHAYSGILAMAGMLSVGFLIEVGTTLNDTLVTIFPLVSLLLIITSLEKLTNKRNVAIIFMCSGFMAGIGCGLKLTTVVYALGLFLSLLFLPVNWINRLYFSFVFGVSCLLGLVATNGYWMYKMWLLFGNPLFPQYNNIFHGYLAQFQPIRDTTFLPKNFLEAFIYPFISAFKPIHVSLLSKRLVSWAFVYIVVILWLIKLSTSQFNRNAALTYLKIQEKILLVFFVSSYFLWLNMFAIYRYLITLELLFPLVTFIGIGYLINSELARRIAITLIIGLAIIDIKGKVGFGRSGWSDPIYRVEESDLSRQPYPAAIYLIGYPLAWIIPALNIPSPFIQVTPNFPASQAYWLQAKKIIEGRQGKKFVVVNPSTLGIYEIHVSANLAKLNLTVDWNNCKEMNAFLGKEKSVLKYCEIIDEAHL